MKMLFVGDLHVSEMSNANAKNIDLDISRDILNRAKNVDIVVLGGDLTNNAGRPEQYDRLISLYSPLGDKCVPVRGNHDSGEFMNRIKSWIPANTEVCFEPGSYPVWIWTTDWFQMLEANTKCFSLQKNLPEPYNRYAQPPVIVVQDGIGPYYAFEREGFKFIVLDTSTHRLGERQQSWLTEEIKRSRMPIIILMHHNILPTGSIDDLPGLWDKQPVLRHLIDNPFVLGVFCGHVHYNRIWDWKGKKIVTTAEREFRSIELKDGKITFIEPLNNERCNGRAIDGDTGQSLEQPLDLRFWWPDGILAPNTFWSLSSHDLWWPKGHWGWHNPEGSGGLIWSVPPELLPYEKTWFGVSFRSTTPWELIVERNGVETVVQKGSFGDNLTATGSFERGNICPCRVVLKQHAPACGHACAYLTLSNAPVCGFNRYP